MYLRKLCLYLQAFRAAEAFHALHVSWCLLRRVASGSLCGESVKRGSGRSAVSIMAVRPPQRTVEIVRRDGEGIMEAQMAESVDALVSNTNGAIRAGSIPALGT